MPAPDPFQGLYAVALYEADVERCAGLHTIRFFWADDTNHAYEQARDAEPGAEVNTVARVPQQYLSEPTF